MLHRAAFMMTLSVVMATGVFVSDTLLNYRTSTVEFDQYLVPSRSTLELGRGISKFCLDFDRTRTGFPCSVEYNFVDPHENFEQTEASRLQHSTSRISEI